MRQIVRELKMKITGTLETVPLVASSVFIGGCFLGYLPVFFSRVTEFLKGIMDVIQDIS